MGASYSRASHEKLLREVYLRDFRRQFNVKSIMLQTFQRNTRNFAAGKNISIGVHAGAGSSHAWVSDNSLPPPSTETVKRATFNYKMMTQRVEIAGDFEADAKGGKASDAQPLDLAMRSVLVNARHALNFDLFGNGDGLLCTPATATSATSLTVDHVRGLKSGERVDILLKTTGATDAGVVSTEVNVNVSTKTLTLLGGKVLADFTTINSSPTLYGVYRHKSYNNAIFGLEAIVSTSNPASGNYGNIDRSLDDNDFWRAVDHNNSGSNRVATDLMMQDLIDDIETQSNGEVDLMICHPKIWSSIANRFTQNKRWEGNEMMVNGWARAVKFAGIPIVRDKHCDESLMYFLTTGSFKIYQNDDGKWMDQDGAILSRVTGFVAYEAAWYRRMQLVCMYPKQCGVLKDLKQS